MRRPARRQAALLCLALAGCFDAPRILGCDPHGALTPVCGLQNPEDLVALPGGAWLALSQYRTAERPGNLLALQRELGDRLLLWPPAPDAPVAAAPAPALGDAACPGPPAADVFAPHGIDLASAPDGGALLLVVNHGGREAVEIFALGADADGPALAWRGCAVLPPDAWGNDVAALPGGGFLVSNMAPDPTSPLTLARILLGRDTGEVLEWTPGAGWRAIPHSRAGLPNGVEVSADGSRVFVGAYGDRALVALSRDGGGRREAALPITPDNLTWAADGRLLVAGGLGAPLSALTCRDLEGRGTCGLPFAVLAVDPESLAVEVLLEGVEPRGIGAVSVALEVDGALWLGTFAGDRVAHTTPAR